MTTTKTLGTSGADFTSTNSWVSYVQANLVTAGILTDNIVIDTLNVGVTPSGSDTITGWTAGGFTTTLTSLGSHSFAGNASVRTNALVYNSSNGAFIDYSSSSSYTLENDVTLFTMSRLQFQSESARYKNCINDTSGSCSYIGNIFNVTLNSDVYMLLNLAGGTLQFYNNLVVMAGAQAAAIHLATFAGTAYIDYNTCYSSNGFIPDGWFKAQYAATLIQLENNAYFNISVEFGNNGRPTSVLNTNSITEATSNSSFASSYNTQTGPITSIVASTELVGGGSFNDFRLASGSVKLKNAGTVVATPAITTDISGQTRSLTTPCVGCWEIAASSGVTGSAAWIEAKDVWSGTGTITNNGTAAWTEAKDVWAGTGTVLVSGSAAWTEAKDIWAGTGTITSSGAAAWIEAPDTWSGSGTVSSGITGASAWTEAQDAWAGTGTVLVSGVAAWTEQQDIWSGTGTITLPTITGTAGWTEVPDIWSGQGTSGAQSVGGHFLPLTKAQMEKARREARRIQKAKESLWSERAKEIDDISSEMAEIANPKPKIEPVVAKASRPVLTVRKAPEDDEDAEIELLLLSA